MSIGMGGAMRAGLVSGKAAAKWKKPAILSATRAQKSKMAEFDGKSRDEGANGNSGSVGMRKELSSKAHQTGEQASKGGRVNASYAPGRHAINEFPQGQSRTFPAGKKFAGGPTKKTGNIRMKGPIPRSGGLYGGGGKGTQ